MLRRSMISRIGLLALSLLILGACSGKNSAPSAESKTDKNGPGTELADKASENPEDYNWTIYVQDSSTINVGEMQMDFDIDLTAVNTTGRIDGLYTGSATTKAVSHMEDGRGSINAPVEGKSTSLSFTVSPYIADEDKLAPLTPPDPDDDKLAPLVPSDDDKLAPLEDPNQPKPEYEGSGSMVLQSGGTGTLTSRGYSYSRGIGNTSTNPLHVTITGTQVRLEVQIPEVGAVYFDGTIRGEGKK